MTLHLRNKYELLFACLVTSRVYLLLLQVGKCEKFGYGYMLSQVTGTAVGMAALLNTGFTSTMVKSLWSVLEVVEDYPVYTPRVWPTSDIDKNARKLFVNLINILSSFCAVYEVLGNKALPTRREYSFRDMPDSIGVRFYCLPKNT